ncbi:Uu.00g116040.m01.CDS01 [Anthostomella pinea]|uniref:Uu.00g116040.m01.CDS01 n=1 Tax=Anthostomella pinea TaxID=933095 RepID=A0AAI8VGW6_9PEZI|nr:Uu.00g116040.m01.CDS01 [Anthostomella pinea]
MASRSGNTDRTLVMGGGGGTTRPSMAPQQSGGVVKARQLTHLHSQLAQLSANLANTENLLRMTSVQAEAMRGLGSWHGGMFMAASKVLGEESVKEQPPQHGGSQR